VREPTPLATGKKQTEHLCSLLRTRPDRVLDVFCQGNNVGGLMDLRQALGLGSNENDIYRGYALTAQSTALAARSVSAINPRVMFILPHTDKQDMVILAFARGEQTAEIVVRSQKDDVLQFYLLTYTQDCNDTSNGCAPGDLLTEAAETGWQNVNVYAEEDLENTPRDCRTCHQSDGPGTPKFLRMQEEDAPWNHWFWRQSTGGQAVIDDYYAAKGNEVFAGIPGEQIITSQPGLLNFALFSVDSPDQPNKFMSSQIEQEVVESAAALGGNQPTDNSIPGESPTWNAIYERSKRGDAIPVPYHDVKVTDAGKLASMSQAYQDYLAGKIERSELPDIRDVYPDDELLRAQIGLTTEPGLDGKGVLLQACGQCHNERLDQGLSRSRFNVDLSKIDRGEKAAAIVRIMLPANSPSVMPPAHARSLSDDGRKQLISYLQR
jgi:mono/diheme cytochrome c family protein